MRGRTWILALALTAPLGPDLAAAAEVRVAAATNAKGALTVITERFESRTGHAVTLSFGSTGKHYAQIVNGAPPDRSTFFSLPPTKKASCRLSGDQNGKVAPSPSGTGCATSEPRART